jgi:putative SOS response-associated peptidase YedK
MLRMSQGFAFCPMRYRLRPFDSEQEVPSKYNLYNARVEAIETKKTWAPLLGSKHVAVPLKKFHEWVPTKSGKKVVQFKITDKEIFWVAGLYDIWKDPTSNGQIVSFALITQAPNAYIQNVGHDRSPIIINDDDVGKWLSINNSQQALTFLQAPRNYSFTHEWEDPLFTLTQQVKTR